MTAMSLWECGPTPCRLCGEDMYLGYDICIYCGWDQTQDPSEYPEIYQQEDDYDIPKSYIEERYVR